MYARLLTGAFFLVLFFGIAASGLAQQVKNPFSLSDIETLLISGVSSERIAGLVVERGVNFESTVQSRDRLRKAGANSALLKAVDNASADYVAAKFPDATKKTVAVETEKRKPEPIGRIPITTKVVGKYGPDTNGVQLGMTDSEARQTFGNRLRLHEEYRNFIIYQVFDADLLAHKGQLELQFDNGNLTRFNHTWSKLDEQTHHSLEDRILDWAKISKNSLKDDKEDIDSTTGRKMVRGNRIESDHKVTILSGMAAFTKDRSVVLEVSSLINFPLLAGPNEKPIRDSFSVRDEAFSRSISRARFSKGVLSAYHGVYKLGTCEPLKVVMEGGFNAVYARISDRTRFVLWSEGQMVFMHFNLSYEHSRITIVKNYGIGDMTLTSEDSREEHVKALDIDVDEHIGKGLIKFIITPAKLLASDNGNPPVAKNLKIWKKCEKL